MESYTLTLNGRESELTANYYPPLELNESCDYVCGLSDFHGYNSIPNVDESNNSFLFFLEKEKQTVTLESNGFYNYLGLHNYIKARNKDLKSVISNLDDSINKEIYDRLLIQNNITFAYDDGYKNHVFVPEKPKAFDFIGRTTIKIPTGSYEIDEIFTYLKTTLKKDYNVDFEASVDKNTLKSKIKCTHKIDFTTSNNIGSLFGFEKKYLYETNTVYESENIVNIFKVNAIRIECDLIKGSYINDKAVHTIHEFFPKVSSGYKIVEVPNNIIYFPLAVRDIHSINIRILDQDDNLVNFRGENITVRLHIKTV